MVDDAHDFDHQWLKIRAQLGGGGGGGWKLTIRAQLGGGVEIDKVTKNVWMISSWAVKNK